MYHFKLIQISKTVSKYTLLREIVNDNSTLKSIRNDLKHKSEVILAKIDQDGFIERLFKGLNFSLVCKKSTYTKRINNEIKIVVLRDEVLAIRKKYSSHQNFMMEAECLNLLRRNMLVPKLLRIDYRNLVSYLSFIPGDNLRLELYSKGAKIIDSSPSDDLSKRQKWIFRLFEGRKILNNVSYNEVMKKILREYINIKKMGIEVNDIKYGNLIINRSLGTVHFIDFDRSFYLPKVIRFLSDKNDNSLFKLHFFNLGNRSKI